MYLHLPYQQCGLPGCAFSQDGVHVAWDRCPSSLRSEHSGKENYPTIVWNVNVSHTTHIYNIHGHYRDSALSTLAPHNYKTWRGGFKGAINDKSMVQDDPLVAAVGKDTLYTEFEYEVYINEEGDTRIMKGIWILNDGGYHRWLHTLAGPKAELAPTLEGEFWGGRCESIRKDAERCFGILKKRFRILRLPFLYHKAKDIDTTFKVCAILHNMLLQYDGLDTIGRFDTDYTSQEECDDDIAVDDFLESLPTTRELEEEAEQEDPRSRFTPVEQTTLRPAYTPVTPETDLGLVGSQCVNIDSEVTEEDPDYETKRQILMTHFKHAWARKEVKWLKKASECRPLAERDPLGAPGPWRREQ